MKLGGAGKGGQPHLVLFLQAGQQHRLLHRQAQVNKAQGQHHRLELRHYKLNPCRDTSQIRTQGPSMLNKGSCWTSFLWYKGTRWGKTCHRAYGFLASSGSLPHSLRASRFPWGRALLCSYLQWACGQNLAQHNIPPPPSD